MDNEEIEKKENNVVKLETMQENPDNSYSDEGFAPSENKNVDGSRINKIAIWIKDFCHKFVFWIKNNIVVIWVSNIWNWITKKDPEYEKVIDTYKKKTENLIVLSKRVKEINGQIAKLKKEQEKYERYLSRLEGAGFLTKIFKKKDNEAKKAETKEKIEKIQDDITNKKEEMFGINENMSVVVNELTKNTEAFRAIFLDKTSWFSRFKSWFINIIVTTLLLSGLTVRVVYWAFDKLMLKNDDIRNGDIVIVVPEQKDFTDILNKAKSFANEANLPIMLAGTEDLIAQMNTTLINWEYKGKIIKTKHAEDLNARVVESYARLESEHFEKPIVFTDPIKIPRTRCEFNKRKVNAKFYKEKVDPFKFNKETVKDAITYDPVPTTSTLKEAFVYYVLSPECWFPGGSGRK